MSTVYGDEDHICPVHQGNFLKSMLDVPIYVIPGAGHMPYMAERGAPFAEVTS